jgi:hypothetical protein
MVSVSQSTVALLAGARIEAGREGLASDAAGHEVRTPEDLVALKLYATSSPEQTRS